MPAEDVLQSTQCVLGPDELREGAVQDVARHGNRFNGFRSHSLGACACTRTALKRPCYMASSLVNQAQGVS